LNSFSFKNDKPFGSTIPRTATFIFSLDTKLCQKSANL
jgi:hypothetical protein